MKDLDELAAGIFSSLPSSLRKWRFCGVLKNPQSSSFVNIMAPMPSMEFSEMSISPNSVASWLSRVDGSSTDWYSSNVDTDSLAGVSWSPRFDSVTRPSLWVLCSYWMELPISCNRCASREMKLFLRPVGGIEVNLRILRHPTFSPRSS